MPTPLRSIAIAEDDRAIVAVLQRWIGQKGYELVGTAANGLEAVALIRSKKPDLLFLDHHMPGGDGLDVIRQIKSLGTTAIILLTGDPSPALAQAAMDEGAAGYILKPIELENLSALLETVWHQFQMVQTLTEETRKLNETLEVRKLLEKAKGILMEQQGMTEESAHKTLLKMSQDQGITLKELCRSVIHLRTMLGKGASKPSSTRHAA